MIEIIITAITIFIISLVFSMFGKGGGELYLPVMLTLLSIPFYVAAGVSLFLILLQSISMIFVYSHKHKLVDWKVALLLTVVVGVSSFLGGFVSAS
ncbi:MAG: TSUP family transporter, partial [Thermoplasmata archaeon]|nr:TSUP family transporter [Thermoplasmata archaeon]